MNRKEWRFFLLACGLKLGLAGLLHHGHPSGPAASAGVFAVRGADTFSYLDPVENLLRHGTYAQDLARLDTYAGRTPGYGVVYGALRLVASPGPAADGVVVLQLLLSLFSLYCLARLAQQASQRDEAFQWTVLLYAANTFTTVFDIRLLTESFATSALIIGIYLLARAHRQSSYAELLGAGAWLAWAVFLRPFLAPLLGLLVGGYAALAVLPAARRVPARRRRYALGATLLGLPFLLADSAWLGRNWAWYHRPVPLQSSIWAGYKTAPGLEELTIFIGTIGEEPAWWNASNDIAWFYKPMAETAPNFCGQASKLAPPAFTYDSLLLVRCRLVLAQDPARPQAARQAAMSQAVRALATYSRAYRRHRPFRALVVAPLKLAYYLIFAHPGDYVFQRPFAELSPLKKTLKILVHLWYLFLVGMGVVGTLLAGWRARPEALLSKAVPVYVVVILCFVLHQVEARYFVVAYPFVVLGAVNLLLTPPALPRNARKWASERVKEKLERNKKRPGDVL